MGIRSHCGLEDGRVKLAEKVRVQPLNRCIRILLIHQEAHIDVGSTVRNHKDIDIADASKHFRGHAGGVSQIPSDKTE